MRNRRREHGNVLFIVLIAIVLIGALTYTLSRGSEHGSGYADKSASDSQISTMLSYVGTLASAVQQMIVNGAEPDTFYTDIVLATPADAAFNTAPHTFKIYHPFGGGINVMTETGDPNASDTVATNFRINPGSIVEGVGETDAVVGDILFTAHVSSLENCQRINQVLRNSTAVPVVSDANTFQNLFLDTGAITAATLDATTCADCVSLPMSCVSNATSDDWGYYAVLLPG